MEYYAATLREPGEKLNNDGLMIKAVHTKKRSDVVVMVLSAHKKAAKLNDKIIRAAEKMIYKEADGDIENCLQRLFIRFGKGGLIRRRKNPDITILILKGINYHIMNRGNNRVMRIGRTGATEIHCENVSDASVDYCYATGRLSEGSTLIVGTQSFYERQLGADIHKRMCPQMCIDNETMQENIEYLRSLLFSRGEERPVTAAALCMK
ncbi:hypothetical protein [Butyrivibrio sp. XPD2002]|uniref:hypothetical protein n=1 Tax=Butyrivibrio sp. XPD2002 TaxID=1280665 RepID=UPI0004280D2F|nr:hypothetical protein [Butyrivibrio sp. XPD2002]